MTIACEDAYYVLRFNRAAYTKFIESGGAVAEEGVEEAFEFVTEVPERYCGLMSHSCHLCVYQL